MIIIKKVSSEYSKVYFDFLPSEPEVNEVLFENKLKAVRVENGIFKSYPYIILARKLHRGEI